MDLTPRLRQYFSGPFDIPPGGSRSFKTTGRLATWTDPAGRRTVGFGNHPELFTRASVIGAQELEAVLQTEIVFLDVLGWNFSPVAADMASKEVPRLLAGFFNRSQRTGGDNYKTKC